MIINYIRDSCLTINYIEIHNDQGAVHNEYGPARIYHINSRIDNEIWIINGVWHNEKGPAYVEYASKGVVSYKSYWLYDKKLTKQQWEDQLVTKLYW